MGSLFEQIEKHAAENKRLQARVHTLEKERAQLASEFASSPGGMSVERQMQWCLALQEGSDE